MYRGQASMVTLAHQFKHVTKGLWLFKTGGSDAQFQSDAQKPLEVMITWHFLITDYLESTLEIADSWLTQGNYNPHTINKIEVV